MITLNKVLIVEDSALQAKMYKNVFSSFGSCEVLCAQNGFEALEMLALNDDIDLILLDINMPRMDGLTFLKKKSEGVHGEIPVIVNSTEGKDSDILKAVELGARGYIKKPWKPEDIFAVIRKVFQ